MVVGRRTSRRNASFCENRTRNEKHGVQYPPSRDGILCGILFQDERLVLIMIATPADSLLFFSSCEQDLLSNRNMSRYGD